MNSKASSSKSCDPQLSTEQPTVKWGVEDLGQYARDRHQEIEVDERSLATLYWRLGLALNLARRQFVRGQWGKFLDDLGINKTRASKGRAIQRTFKNEQSVDGLSVHQAYHRRKRKQPAKPRNRKTRSKTPPLPRMEEFLRDVCEQIVAFQEETTGMSPESAKSHLQAVSAVLGELSQLAKQLQDLCKSSP